MAYPGSSYKLLFTLVDPVSGAALNGQTFDSILMRRNGADAAGGDIATLNLTAANIDATYGVYEVTGTIPSGWNYDDEIQVRLHFTVGAAVRSIAGPKEFLRLQNVRKGTAQAGAAASITLDAGASPTADAYANCPIFICGGTGAGQAPRVITAYNGGTKVATVDRNWLTNPDATSVFAILPAVMFQDAFTRIGVGGAGLGAIGDARLECLDQRVSIGFKDVAHNDLVDQLTAYVGAAGVNLTNIPALVAALKLLRADEVIDKTTNPARWKRLLKEEGTATVLVTKELYDVNGADLHTEKMPGRALKP